MRRILLLADDLSGAAECGMPCLNAGLEVIVALGAPAALASTPVIAIDADTRRLSAFAAAERVRQLAEQYASDPDVLLFKKIDSTLRGHLGPELAAVLQARNAVVPRSVALVAPAFPVYGRTTLGGRHYVDGKLLHETEIWKREKTVEESYIPQLLSGSGLRCAALHLAVVRGPSAELDRALSESAATADAIVCDATTTDDLRAIAAAAVNLGGRAVWVGSAGLAQELPRALGLAASGHTPIPQLSAAAGPILFVIGSANQTTRRQVAALLESSDVRSIVVSPEVLLQGPAEPQWISFSAQLESAVQSGSDVILTCAAEPPVDLEHRSQLSHALGELSRILRRNVGALVLSGGETARNVLEYWGVTGLRLRGELDKGVSISQTISDGMPSVTVITKAGDFGQKNTFVHCREWLSGHGGFQ